MKKRPMISGVVAACCPIPLAFITILWSWVCVYPIGTDLFNYVAIPGWLTAVALLPSILGLLAGIAAFLHGIAKYQTPKAWLAITLSTLGIIESAVIIDRLLLTLNQLS